MTTFCRDESIISHVKIHRSAESIFPIIDEYEVQKSLEKDFFSHMADKPSTSHDEDIEEVKEEFKNE